jgi:hypothetical protein
VSSPALHHRLDVSHSRAADKVRKKAGDQTFATVTFVWMQGEAAAVIAWPQG